MSTSNKKNNQEQIGSDLVSIIVPCFNCAKYLKSTVNNILAQSYSNIECIIVDDGSSDNSRVISEELEAQDSRIRYLPKEHDGVAAARNFGIQHARGVWIQQLDSDDFLHKNKIELHMKQLTSLDTSRDIIFYTDWDIIWEDKNQQLTQGDTIIVGEKSREQLLDQLLKWNFKPNSPLSNNTLLVKKSAFSHKMYDENLGSFEDFDLFTSLLLEDILFVYTPITGMSYRQHTSNMTRDKNSMIDNYIKYLKSLHKKDKTLLGRCTTIGPLLRETMVNNDKKLFLNLTSLINETQVPAYFFHKKINTNNTGLLKILFHIRTIIPILTVKKFYNTLAKLPKRIRWHLKHRIGI